MRNAQGRLCGFKESIMKKREIEIVDYHPRYEGEFKRLNIEWLEKYFYVEPRDKEVLGNPEKYILEPGGHIFFAKLDGEVVGTLALIKLSDDIYELSKMAVTPTYQGQKIGQKLLKHSICFAKEKQWKELVLYSNRKLENAIYLYLKYGFEEVEINEENPYDRGDIKMSCALS